MSTIKPKLLEALSGISEEDIDTVLSTYFNQAKKDITSYSKPEVSLLWGTLRIKPQRLKEKINFYETVKSNLDQPINDYTPEKFQVLEERTLKFRDLLELHNQTRLKGKTSRGVYRRNYESKNQSQEH